jgi:hypothetical protein
MITTITTTTTTVATAHLATVVGSVAVVILILFLIAKELLSAAEVDSVHSVESSGWMGKSRLLADKANIPIYPLLFVFGAIVVTQVVTILK